VELQHGKPVKDQVEAGGVDELLPEVVAKCQDFTTAIVTWSIDNSPLQTSQNNEGAEPDAKT